MRQVILLSLHKEREAEEKLTRKERAKYYSVLLRRIGMACVDCIGNSTGCFMIFVIE